MGERIYIIVGLLLFVIGIRTIIVTRLSNDLAEKSIYYSTVRQQIDLLKSRNQKLQNEIDYQEALTTIASRAAELGFYHAGSSAYILINEK